ncbi:MAG: thiopurine S-methyltransferase [Pseudomonadales bacterium]|nr:thiopurine S-methyltransferase [Pseudomonadales bacterium]
MKAEFWHESWQKNQIGFHLSEVHPLLRRHWAALDVMPGAHVFVPLCGKSLDILWLLQQGYQVSAVELSALAIDAFLAEAGIVAERQDLGALQCYSAPGLKLYCGDFFALQAEHLAGVTVVYDRAALVALPPAMREHYCRHLLQLLAGREVQLLLITLEYDQALVAGPPHSVSSQEVAAHYGAVGIIQLLDARLDAAPPPRFTAAGIPVLLEKAYQISLHGNTSEVD